MPVIKIRGSIGPGAAPVIANAALPSAPVPAAVHVRVTGGPVGSGTWSTVDVVAPAELPAV